MSFNTDIFKSFAAGERPNAETFGIALNTILRGEASDMEVSALLLGLEMVGLSSDIIRVGVETMRAHMTPVHIEADIIDIVGTGGTGLHTLSISTASALVCAGAGAKVAKHGNRAASSLTGTADTLSELGVNLAISPEKAAECVDKAGVGFLFAPNHHPAMRHVGPARKALGIRTLFNLLGPMSNPAGAKRMLVGVNNNDWRHLMAEAFAGLSMDHVWIVHGSDGLDEITTTGPTAVSEVKNGTVKELNLSPQSYGISLSTIESLRGGHPAENAQALLSLLDGEHSDYRDIVLLNSAAALMIAGLASDIPQGLDKAISAIDSGLAHQALRKLIEVSHG
ncbi:anthranilate phosphoribosyltransferase [Litorimonas taeanensis]|uniref:Anthranilate phosphoribosyltransferase n=1 Tax=Litorimonas taeanensis TaxID=568099 RepID=A0A420WL28_9PROT|nr:anthranilate phosphoribosyltransferase [Litorimonas taeanensis]RKQ71616.1 anthranilate phosphoribosyltransferase [Litorimonas taeanensis]